MSRDFFESRYLPSTLNQTFGLEHSDALLLLTVHEYTDWSDPENTITVRDAMIDLYTDLGFLVPAIQTAKKHADNTLNRNTYLYKYSHKIDNLPPLWIDGALHTWELGYVFGLPASILVAAGIPGELVAFIPVKDINFSRAVMKYWTNFAKTGYVNLIFVCLIL